VADGLRGLVPALRAGGHGLVFNLVESIDNDYGREWQVPALLARHGLKYTGNDAAALKLCCKKDRVRRVLERASVRVAKGVTVSGKRELAALERTGRLPLPAFVKPARVDGSIGIDARSKCDDLDALTARLDALRASKIPGPYLIEAYLPGKEINVSVFPNGARNQVAITEIDFSEVPARLPRFVTYDGKWNPKGKQYASRSVPARLSPTLRREVTSLALRAFAALGLKSYGRIDLRLDAEGKPTVIDVNPNCDIHADAGLSVSSRSVGVSYPELIRRVVERAKKS
jgi:D-alanine-D-alanine ligase